MPFVENGRVVERRSMMRVATLADIFWGVLNGIYALYASPPHTLPPVHPLPHTCVAAHVPGPADTHHALPRAASTQ